MKDKNLSANDLISYAKERLEFLRKEKFNIENEIRILEEMIGGKEKYELLNERERKNKSNRTITLDKIELMISVTKTEPKTMKELSLILGIKRDTLYKWFKYNRVLYPEINIVNDNHGTILGAKNTKRSK